jgi:hypothetical protein
MWNIINGRKNNTSHTTFTETAVPLLYFLDMLMSILRYPETETHSSTKAKLKTCTTLLYTSFMQAMWVIKLHLQSLIPKGTTTPYLENAKLQKPSLWSYTVPRQVLHFQISSTGNQMLYFSVLHSHSLFRSSQVELSHRSHTVRKERQTD